MEGLGVGLHTNRALEPSDYLEVCSPPSRHH